ncbi:MAG: amidohydrolase family protein [Sphingomonadales bacterium]|nr:amidohydrolase family protein [Sphingomonadales bacterium]
MLIRRAEVWRKGLADVRIAEGRIAAIGALEARPGEAVIEAHGGALLPGLHDHHIHLAALTARRDSVLCGPPDVTDRNGLARRLAEAPGTGWLRGIGYHESVMGLPGARELDALLAHRPLRLQHRSGRMWLLNSAALDDLLSRAAPPSGLEREAGGYSGRLFEGDDWLQQTLAASPPDLTDLSRELAACGITGMTDMSPRNGDVMAAHVAAQRASGGLLQRCTLAGTLELAEVAEVAAGTCQLGPAKLHLHEADLPAFDRAEAFLRAAHAQERAVAVHCVSEVELVFAVALFEAAGTVRGDRIEHASVASDAMIARMAALGLHVCVQPHFIAERGDRYLVDVEPQHHAELYRLQSLKRAGLHLCGGSDAPFGSADPWQAMAAARSRRTDGGQVIGENEALTAEEALTLYLADPADITRQRSIAPGQVADLCLLGCDWQSARLRLSADDVRATIVGGHLIHDGIDQPPI